MLFSSIFCLEPGTTGAQVQSILRAVRKHLNMDVGFVSEFVEDRRVFRFSDGELDRNPIDVGTSDPLEQSFCHYIARGLMPGLLNDAKEDEIASGLPVTNKLPVGAHLSVPLRYADGMPFGTLCCFSFTPNRELTTRDLGILRLCADMVGAVLQKDRYAVLDIENRRAKISEIIRADAINIVFQPIYRVSNGHVTGFEALARFMVEPIRAPDAWFADAAAVGLGEELELLAVRKTLRAFPHLDSTVKLTVNLSPGSVLSSGFVEAIADAPLERLVIELTEHAVIEDYNLIRNVLEPFRSRGLRLAVDDVGAGHSTFRHVLDLRPELIKLDRSLIQGIDADNARRALAEALTAYARNMGCEVVAEGVETIREYNILKSIGITRVQGFLTGRPMSLEQARSLPLQKTTFE